MIVVAILTCGAAVAIGALEGTTMAEVPMMAVARTKAALKCMVRECDGIPLWCERVVDAGPIEARIIVVDSKVE